MMRVVFRPPTQSDLDALASSMRAMDVKECALIAGLAPREALAECVAGSENASVAVIDGKVVCAFGSIANFMGDEAHPWMLCAEGVEHHARALLVCAPRFLAAMRKPGQRLHNVVHADNRPAIRFLRWLGFVFGETFAMKGERFVTFEMAAPAMAEAA